MLKESVYYLVAVFSVVTLFYFGIPAWNTFYNSWNSVTSNVVTDSTFSSILPTLENNLNTIIQYAIVAILVGLGVYIALVPFREEPTSYTG